MEIPYIFNIQRFSVHDGPGIRTTVFFKGCPLSCLWCHNPESQRFEPEYMIDENGKKQLAGVQYDTDELVRILEKDQIFYDQSGGGVTLSGGEVMAQDISYIAEVAEKLQRKGISVAIDTCGYAPRENFRALLPYTDLFLYDLKTISPQKHVKGTGAENQLILDNLRYLSSCDAQIILRLIMIADFNMDAEDIETLISWLKKEKIRVEEVNLLPYHDFGRDKYEKLSRVCTQHFKKPETEQMEKIVKRFEKAGYRVNIGG